MKSLSNILVAVTMLLSFTSCDAQIKNAKTESVKIFGNCGMCEKTIEKSGSLKKIAKVDWNKDTKIATLTYDAKKTTQDEILKRIALAGYDSDNFRAPDNTYKNLPGCCQYERNTLANKAVNANTDKNTSKGADNQHNHSANPAKSVRVTNPLQAVYDNYFAVKNALVKTDAATTSAKSTALLLAVNAVQMDKLENNVHIVWMKLLDNIKTSSQKMAASKDIEKQRSQFIALSKSIYELMKVSKSESPTYYQFCPMANDGKGANWLSKESAVKNPYYGSMMLSCGKTVETIK